MDTVNLYENLIVMQYKGPASLHTTHIQITDTQHIIVHSCIYIRTYKPYPPCSLTCDFCGKMLMATGRAEGGHYRLYRKDKARVGPQELGPTRGGGGRKERCKCVHVYSSGMSAVLHAHVTAHLKRSCVQSASISTTQLSLLQLSHDDGRDDKDWGREEEPGPSSLNNGLGGDRIGNGNGKFALGIATTK